MRKIFPLILLFISTKAFAQIFDNSNDIINSLEKQRTTILEDRDLIIGYNIGLTCNLGKNNVTELRFNFSTGISRGFGWKSDYTPFLGTYQIQIEAFRGGVGSSLLGGNRSKFVWDLRNILQINSGLVSNNSPMGRPLTKLLGTSEYSIRDPYDYSIGIGTVFINGLNHERNQQLGFLSLGVLQVSACYANDGPFFHKIGLGDGYDRWWTGAGYLGVYFKNDYGFITDISIQYNRYTGWQPNLYEMSNMLGLDYISYRDGKEQFFNQGAWIISFGVRNTLRIDYKIYEAKKLDIQNLLHVGNKYTFHPNSLRRRFTLGGGLMLNGYQSLNF
ncbi:MAG: hypothetical protein AB8B74_06465 [Crocinitomicaceae bacterium]